MSGCSDGFEKLPFDWLFDLNNSVVVQGRVATINRTAKTASVTLIGECSLLDGVNLGEVPFFYHCEDSSGTVEELENGHKAFAPGDHVYMLFSAERATDRLHIIGHADLRATHRCILPEYLEVLHGNEGVIFFDLHNGKMVDPTTFPTIDDESPPGPSSYPVKYSDSNHLGWRLHNFDEVTSTTGLPPRLTTVNTEFYRAITSTTTPLFDRTVKEEVAHVASTYEFQDAPVYNYTSCTPDESYWDIYKDSSYYPNNWFSLKGFCIKKNYPTLHGGIGFERSQEAETVHESPHYIITEADTGRVLQVKLKNHVKVVEKTLYKEMESGLTLLRSDPLPDLKTYRHAADSATLEFYQDIAATLQVNDEDPIIVPRQYSFSCYLELVGSGVWFSVDPPRYEYNPPYSVGGQDVVGLEFWQVARHEPRDEVAEWRCGRYFGGGSDDWGASGSGNLFAGILYGGCRSAEADSISNQALAHCELSSGRDHLIAGALNDGNTLIGRDYPWVDDSRRSGFWYSINMESYWSGMYHNDGVGINEPFPDDNTYIDDSPDRESTYFWCLPFFVPISLLPTYTDGKISLIDLILQGSAFPGMDKLSEAIRKLYGFVLYENRTSSMKAELRRQAPILKFYRYKGDV